MTTRVPAQAAAELQSGRLPAWVDRAEPDHPRPRRAEAGSVEPGARWAGAAGRLVPRPRLGDRERRVRGFPWMAGELPQAAELVTWVAGECASAGREVTT